MNERFSTTDRSGASRMLPLAFMLVLGIGVGAAGLWLVTDRPAAEPAAAEHANELPAGTAEVPEAAQKNAGIEVNAVATTRLPGTLEVTGIVTPDESRVAHVRPLAKGGRRADQRQPREPRHCRPTAAHL
jgi:hypothetical protein